MLLINRFLHLSLKITLKNQKGVYRTIQVPEYITIHEMDEYILDTFDFPFDEGYEVWTGGAEKPVKRTDCHFVTELDLQVGQTFRIRMDHGLFKARVIRVTKSETPDPLGNLVFMPRPVTMEDLVLLGSAEKEDLDPLTEKILQEDELGRALDEVELELLSWQGEVEWGEN